MRTTVSAAGPLPFGTKAETLRWLAGRLRTATVLPLFSFTVARWLREPGAVLDELCRHPWARDRLVVRSSGLAEDQSLASNAGHYLSVSDVYGRVAARRAVDAVVSSFDGDPGDQVLVQPQLRDARASGVVSSCEPGAGAPYRVVNWARGSDTAAVTGGHVPVCTWYFATDAEIAEVDAPEPELAAIPALVAELEQLIGIQPFEFEFGVGADSALVLFQVRPLARERGSVVSAARHRAAVGRCRDEVRALFAERPPALGSDTVLGIMPDWNPAEMIGVRPRPLALSLYRDLITDRVWAWSRARYGYRDVRGVPLLADLGGLPYIDARASFTSLVPASLADAAAHDLVRHYVATLKARPHLHDKVEFAILLSSYDFLTPRRAARLVEEGVLRAADDLVDGLRAVTAAMMRPDGVFEHDMRAIHGLAGHPLPRPETSTPEHLSLLRQLCRSRGTLPFAGIARAAFAATALIRSLTTLGVLTSGEADAVLGGANTVSAALQRDFATLGRAEFLHRYGHLRPGTYDILSSRYDEDPDRYFDWTSPAVAPPPARPFRFTPEQAAAVENLLSTHGLPGTPADLLRFVTRAVAGREYAKLQFSRVVSEILVEVRRAGERIGLSADDMSYTSIAELADFERARVADVVAHGRSRHAVTESLCAPAVLASPEDLTSFVALRNEPNFVTRGRAAARVADVVAGDDPTGAIAVIGAADPGHDWIFTKGIAGLVTAFGGANSHMAIRALELGIPAAIGIGEAQFRRCRAAGALEVDAAARVVRPVVVATPHEELRETRAS